MNKEEKKGIAIVISVMMFINICTYKCSDKSISTISQNNSTASIKYSKDDALQCVGFLSTIFSDRNGNVERFITKFLSAYSKKYKEYYPDKSGLKKGESLYNKICGIGMSSRKSNKCSNYIMKCGTILELDNNTIQEVIRVNKIGYEE